MFWVMGGRASASLLSSLGGCCTTGAYGDSDADEGGTGILDYLLKSPGSFQNSHSLGCTPDQLNQKIWGWVQTSELLEKFPR